MCRTTRKTPWARALALALAATLVASPALARSKKGHGRQRGHPHAREWQQRSDRHSHHAGHARYERNVYYQDRDDDDVDELLLGLGLGAVGLTALALFAQPPRPAYGGYGPAYGGYASPAPAPAPVPIDWNAYDDGVTVMSEGYNERGELCREFQKEIRVGGRVERGWGIACLQEDGSWRIGR